MQNRDIPMPVIAGVLIVLAGLIGFLAWRMFAPPPEPMAGMTDEQKIEAIRRAGEQVPKRTGIQLQQPPPGTAAPTTP